MSVLILFSSVYCHMDPIKQQLLDSTGYRLLTDRDVTGRAAELSAIDEQKIRTVFSTKASTFNQFIQEKERIIA